MRDPDGMRHLMGLVSELNARREERAESLDRLLRPRFRCRIGRHRWVMDRYWSIGGLLVDRACVPGLRSLAAQARGRARP
jgi:hypothetical protein